MTKRRKARECALQILFQMELNPSDRDSILAGYWPLRKVTPETRAYATWLVDTSLARREEIDRRLQQASKNWRMARMAVVDRNILRIALAELLAERTLVPAIVINEAIEIARRYSGDEAAQFVNGVLDAARKTLEEERSSAEGPHERTPGDGPPKPGSGAGSGD